MNHLVLKHGVCNEQSMTDTEVQKQNPTRVQIVEAVDTSAGHSTIANMGIEVPQENDGVLAPPHTSAQFLPPPAR